MLKKRKKEISSHMLVLLVDTYNSIKNKQPLIYMRKENDGEKLKFTVSFPPYKIGKIVVPT